MHLLPGWRSESNSGGRMVASVISLSVYCCTHTPLTGDGAGTGTEEGGGQENSLG